MHGEIDSTIGVCWCVELDVPDGGGGRHRNMLESRFDYFSAVICA